MKRYKKGLIITAVTLLSLIFIIPSILFAVLNWGVLPPEKLTPLVIEQTNKFLEAHLECERIELTYFETYPYLGVKLTNGRLISHMAKDSLTIEEPDEDMVMSVDSLFSFRHATLSIQPLDYLFGGKVTIKNFSLDTPRFFGYVNEKGAANWDIYQSEDTTGSETQLPPIDIQRVRIKDGFFVYDDRQAETFAEISGFFLKLDGSLTDGQNNLDVETKTASILFESPGYTLKNDLALQFKSRLLLADNYNSVTLEGAELLINNLPFTTNGSVVNLPEEKRMRIDLDMGMKISDMNDLLAFIPDAYFQNRDKTIAKGSILLEGDIHGFLSDSIFPKINLCCKVENGSYHIKDIKHGIDTLQMDMDIHLNGEYPDSSFISLEELTMKGLNTSLTMQGEATNLLKNPAIQAKMKGNVDFTRLCKEFLNPDTLLVEGSMNADFSTKFTLNDVLDSRFNKIQANGSLRVDSLKAFSQPLAMDIFVNGARFAIDSMRKDSSRYLKQKDLLGFTMSIDSMNVKYQEDIRTNISQLVMKAQTSPVIDTTAVIPMTGSITFNHLQTRMQDSTWLVTGRTVLEGGIKASASNKQIPTAAARIMVDTLKYISIPLRSGVVLASSKFVIEALPYRDARKQMMAYRTRRDSTRRDSTSLAVNRTRRNRTTTTDSTANGSLLRKWEARGSLSFQQMRGFSRLFPLPLRMDPTTLKFNTNNVTLTDACLHAGKSNFTLSGEINQIRRAMLRGGKLTGKFNLTSDYIDCEQLMKALNKGLEFSEKSTNNSDLAGVTDENIATIDTHVEEAIAETKADTTSQLFIIPAFLDITLNTNAKKIDFDDLKLENVQGEVVIRDQSINLNKLNMHSNIGCGHLTMAYTAKDKTGATTGFDLDMEDILVDKLIGLFPAIDTLVPMLRSFEGVVDCQMSATCKIDSTMSLILPSLNSACYLNGKNMVLLDGETFTEISKTLMFKNKKRNIIEHIAVDFTIKDNKIDVFPFLIEMDRYRVAVGGTHNMDMTFNYHLSVLKSPVPFKLGIDITGNLDDFKYKITKCKYKDIFKPAREAEMDSIRIDIRKEIRAAIRKQIEEAAPELSGSLEVNNVPMHQHEDEQQEPDRGIL